MIDIPINLWTLNFVTELGSRLFSHNVLTYHIPIIMLREVAFGLLMILWRYDEIVMPGTALESNTVRLSISSSWVACPTIDSNICAMIMTYSWISSSSLTLNLMDYFYSYWSNKICQWRWVDRNLSEVTKQKIYFQQMRTYAEYTIMVQNSSKFWFLLNYDKWTTCFSWRRPNFN